VSAPTVVILCGGRGTRLREQTETIPKPLVEIGGRPILWHVIRIYAEQGFARFVLCTGHRGELIEEFVENDGLPRGLEIDCVPTGEDTPTGGRIARVADRLGGERFCATYADGVADIDLAALLRFHDGHGALATMTVVQPELQFGVAELNGDDHVSGFTEKPRYEGWINGGFFCFESGALDYIGPDDVLERGPLERLAAAGQLRAFRHLGFWDCMDTYKDAVLLNDLWADGRAPWKVWA
jgi:glucose-1-phosphate cytidylyltransferase